MKLKVSIRQLVEAVGVHLGATAVITETNSNGPKGAETLREVEFETDDITKVLRFIRKAEK